MVAASPQASEDWPVNEVSQLLAAANDGDREAGDRAFALVYADLKRLARRQAMSGGAGHGATSLVHEAWLRMNQADALRGNDRDHFYALSARVMRQLAVDRARHVTAAKRGGGEVEDDIDMLADHVGALGQAERLLELDQALQRLAAIDPQLVRLVEMRFFAGLELEEIESLTGRSARSLRRDWRRARAVLNMAPDGGADADG